MVVCYFGREVCFYSNAHSVGQNKQQSFQWAAPQFALFSVCGIWGEKHKLQKGKFQKELDCCVCTQVAAVVCWTRSATQSFQQPVCGKRVSLWGQTELFHNRWNMVWKLLGTSGDLMWTAQKSVRRRLNSSFWKNERSRILSYFPYCFNWFY